jgi:two-component system phosphate regulon response regulator OmpR
LYRLLDRESFDALVLDITMPGEDGFAVCSRLRAQGEWLPILMLTARGDLVNRVVGLEMGADDYMTKPFEPRELSARLNAQLRRRRVEHQRPLAGAEIVVGTWMFDTVGGRLMRGQEETLDLKPSEATLLLALVSQPHRPLSRERLIELARGRSVDLSDRTVDVQIMRLRRLIELDAVRPRLIQTVWGVGYMFVPSTQR